MKRFNFLGILVLFCFSLTINSCSTSQIGKLEGQWQLLWLNNLIDPNIYVWNFDGGELTILIYDPTSPLPQPSVGTRVQYKTSAEFLDAVVEISGHVPSISAAQANQMISNGKWTIDIIDDEVLRLATADQDCSNGSYVIREFSRVN